MLPSLRCAADAVSAGSAPHHLLHLTCSLLSRLTPRYGVFGDFGDFVFENWCSTLLIPRQNIRRRKLPFLAEVKELNVPRTDDTPPCRAMPPTLEGCPVNTLVGDGRHSFRFSTFGHRRIRPPRFWRVSWIALFLGPAYLGGQDAQQHIVYRTTSTRHD